MSAFYGGNVTAPDGKVMATYYRIFGTRCIQCGNPVGFSDEFIALGPPYNGCLHVSCAPHYAFPGTWPHASPAVGYRH